MGDVYPVTPPTGDLWLEFDLTRPPGLVEPRLERAVEAQDGELGLPGSGLNPVRFLAGRRLRAEINVHRAVGVHQQIFLQKGRNKWARFLEAR